MSIALQKDSELSDLIDYHLLKLRQSGILEALRLKWLDGREAGDWSGRIFRGEEPGGVGADNLFLPGSVMSLGIALGLVFLAAEALAKLGRCLVLKL